MQPGRGPEVAVITMARDEGDLMRTWVAHYARHVGIDNLVVFDDNSADGSTRDLGCTVHRLPELPGGIDFEIARMRLMNGVAWGLMATYDYVVFVDVDEFLVTDPAKYPTLPDLIEARGRPKAMASLALNLIHVPSCEPDPLDLSRPLLEQRRFAKFAPVMCKPAVKRIAARWVVSSHGLRKPYEVEPELFMIHLKFADRERTARIQTLRHDQSRVDGRAAEANWGRDASEVVSILDRATSGVDPAAVPEFDPTQLRLEDLVIRVKDRYRSQKTGQVEALPDQPWVRVPERLRGAL